MPNLPTSPAQPPTVSTAPEPWMLDFFRRYHLFLNVFKYSDERPLIEALPEVLAPAEKMSTRHDASQGITRPPRSSAPPRR